MAWRDPGRGEGRTGDNVTAPRRAPAPGREVLGLTGALPVAWPSSEIAKPKPVRRRRVVLERRHYVSYDAHQLLEASSNEHARPGTEY